MTHCKLGPGRRLISGCVRAVYGRENRLKVSQDEAKYEEEQKEKRAKHEQVGFCLLVPQAPSCCQHGSIDLLHCVG